MNEKNEENEIEHEEKEAVVVNETVFKKEVLSSERKEKTKYGATVILTLFTICLLYAEYKGVMSVVANVIIIMLYYLLVFVLLNKKS